MNTALQWTDHRITDSPNCGVTLVSAAYKQQKQIRNKCHRFTVDVLIRANWVTVCCKCALFFLETSIWQQVNHFKNLSFAARVLALMGIPTLSQIPPTRWRRSYLWPQLPLHTHVKANQKQKSQSRQHSLVLPQKCKSLSHTCAVVAPVSLFLTPAGLRMPNKPSDYRADLQAPLVNWAGGGAAGGGRGARAFLVEGVREWIGRREVGREESVAAMLTVNWKSERMFKGFSLNVTKKVREEGNSCRGWNECVSKTTAAKMVWK